MYLSWLHKACVRTAIGTGVRASRRSYNFFFTDTNNCTIIFLINFLTHRFVEFQKSIVPLWPQTRRHTSLSHCRHAFFRPRHSLFPACRKITKPSLFFLLPPYHSSEPYLARRCPQGQPRITLHGTGPFYQSTYQTKQTIPDLYLSFCPHISICNRANGDLCTQGNAMRYHTAIFDY